jgi:hypothetical protein
MTINLISIQETTIYGTFEILMIFLLSLCVLIALSFQTKALQIEKAGRVAPVQIL